VLVHPAIRPDAMPTVIKEAMAVGTPVVASDLAGIPEMLDGGRCGILVPPGDVPALAAGIARMLGDPAARLDFATRARAHMEGTFDLWRNGRVLTERLRSTTRHAGTRMALACSPRSPRSYIRPRSGPPTPALSAL